MGFENFLPVILNLISEHGVLAVILGSVVEEILVPIPSPFIPMAAGAIVISSESLIGASLSVLFLISIPASVASVISSYFVYSIAYYGGRPAIDRYGGYLDVSAGEVEKLEKHFRSGRDRYYVALLRAIPVVPLSLVSGGAGVFRMDWKRYGLWSFIGMVPRTFALGMLGWWARDGFMILASRIDSLSTMILFLTAGMVTGFILYRKTQDFYRWLIQRI